MKELLSNKIEEENVALLVLAVEGYGGSGKTTLAQKLFQLVKQHFEFTSCVHPLQVWH